MVHYQDSFQSWWSTYGSYKWRLYCRSFTYGSNQATTTINYVGGSANPTPIQCASNETLINGQTVVENQPPPPPPDPTCSANETLIDGVCVENEPEPIPTCSANETLIDGVCVEN